MVFQQIDIDSTGIIDASELKHYITKFKLGLSDRQILSMI
jgi:calcium-dependent protein kinase